MLYTHREGLPPMPARIKTLRINSKGYPVPYFALWTRGEPDIRVVDPDKVVKCVKEHRCWICGDEMGTHLTFVIGPMCSVNRISGEPPCHHECAEWAVQACPFMLLPMAHRREANLPEGVTVNPAMQPHNPGMSLLWTTKKYRPIPGGNNDVLFKIGPPEHVTWWTEGQPATRIKAMEGLAVAVNALEAMIDKDDTDSLTHLQKASATAVLLLPAE